MAFCGGRLKQQSRSAFPYKQDIYMWLVPYRLKQVTPSMFPGCKYSISSRAPDAAFGSSQLSRSSITNHHVCPFLPAFPSRQHFPRFTITIDRYPVLEDRELLILELTCLSLSPNNGDAIAMARLAGNVLRNSLQFEMDVAVAIDGMAGPGVCDDTCAHSRVAPGDCIDVLSWI
jgi:hypothetical protein